MTKRIAATTFLVPDYDEAVAWFRAALDFRIVEDTPLAEGKRWVVVAPPGGDGAALVLALAADERQRARIGDQMGGRVGYFLHTDDFARDYRAMQARGVRFLETPREETYGAVAVFSDPWGGRWDLLEPRDAATPRGPSQRAAKP